MRRRRLNSIATPGAWLALTCLGLVAGRAAAWAQTPIAATPLTLQQAEQAALANHPRILAAKLLAEAATVSVSEAKASYYPTVSANFTSVGAESSAVAAGAITTSSLASRVAAGFVASQLVTDFGRTGDLAGAASLGAAAQGRHLDDVRAQVVLQVAQAYYEAMGAAAVLDVARADLDNRRVLARQVSSLSQSGLRSTLDVGFSDLGVSQAELGVVRAESAVQAARARLAAAMGDPVAPLYELTEGPPPSALGPDPQPLIDEALKARPDLDGARLQRDAAERFAHAEQRLTYPTISLLGVVGVVPLHDERLQSHYSAAGINVNVPLFNGDLYGSRRTEAALRAQAMSRSIDDLAATVARDVRIAWLEAVDAVKRMDVTTRLVSQADDTLRLARTRYDLGLGGIVELNEAQLSQTSAQVEAARAKYEYLVRRAGLDYAVGRIP